MCLQLSIHVSVAVDEIDPEIAGSCRCSPRQPFDSGENVLSAPVFMRSFKSTMSATKFNGNVRLTLDTFYRLFCHSFDQLFSYMCHYYFPSSLYERTILFTALVIFESSGDIRCGDDFISGLYKV